MDIDPKLTVEKQTGKFVIVSAIDESTKKPFALVINKDTGELRVSAVMVSKTIGSITFIGIGLNDMTNGGEYTGTEDHDYIVEIDLAAGTDEFKWSDDGGATWHSNIPITSFDQSLSNGVTIKFNATTGHTLNDEWAFTARHADPTSIQKNLETIITGSFIGAASVESAPVDLRNVEEATLTISGDFDALAVLGMTVDIFTSPDGITWDTDPWASTGLEPTVTPGLTSQRTSNLDAIPAFMKVKITNHDALSVGNVLAKIVKLEV